MKMRIAKTLILAASAAVCCHHAAAGGKSAGPAPYGVVRASDYGFDPKDSTSALQRAIDSGAAKVIIDRQSGPWVTKPLKITRSDVEVVLEDGVDIVAKRGEFKGKGHRLLTINSGTSNVTVRGVGTARLVMHKRDYQNPRLGYEHSEWRHALAIFAAANVSVSNLQMIASGGDGVYVSGSKDVLLQDLRCLDNHRQGMSPICVDGLTVRRCVFDDTIGTPPQSGMDLEPNRPAQYLKRVLFEDCVFNGNKAHGIDLYFGHLDATTEPVSITFRRCTARNNGFSGITFITGTVKRIYESGQVKGDVLFEDCVSASNGQYALKLANHTPEGMRIRFRNCVFDARGGASDSAILMTNAHLAENTGAVTFENSKVVLEKDMKAVCIENQRGFGLVPGFSGVLDVVRDGKTEKLDLADLARRHAPNPKIAIRFRPREVDFRKLETAAPTEPLKGAQSPEMLTRFVYVAATPQAGEYDIGFRSRLRRKDKTGPCATVQLLDGIGTDLGSFDIPAGDFTYRLKADGKKIYRFEISLKNSGVVRVLNSATTGGILFSSQLRMFYGKNQTFYFHVPEGAKEVFANVVPGKSPASAQLIDPSGRIVDEQPFQKFGRVLRNNPEKPVPSGTWTIRFPEVPETVYLQMSGDVVPLLATEPGGVMR